MTRVQHTPRTVAQPHPLSAVSADTLIHLGMLEVAGQHLQILGRPHARARRYLLRLRDRNSVCVTIPKRGTQTAARAFVDRCRDWIQRQLERSATAPSRAWGVGTQVWWQGEPHVLTVDQENPAGLARLGSLRLPISAVEADLRPGVEAFLRSIAARTLPMRTQELAALHGFRIRRVVVRDQRTRWGSCSRTGTISLNWRLEQTPPEVRDYVILHELAHLLHMNHSKAFWTALERICPGSLDRRAWLRRHERLLKNHSLP